MARKRTMRKMLIGGAAVGGAAWLLRGIPSEVGVRPLHSSAERAERVRRSPQFDGSTFINPMPESTTASAPSAGLLAELATKRGERRPPGPVPLEALPASSTPSDRVRAAWFGHSTVLVELDGARVLIDPVWSNRVSPSQLVGPKRLHPVPAALESLPHLDAVVISHDHYDHLDRATIIKLTRISQAPFLVPLGVGAHLEHWDVPAERIIELDWEEAAEVAGLRIVATAARHFSGRWLTRNDTLWGSWAITGPQHRVFYAGDSGYFEGFGDIGRQHGPFDLTIMPVGAYSPSWPDIHMTPEEAVTAHLDVGGRLLLPVHWGTFTLALHPWAEPIERLWAEAKARDVTITVPRPGQAIDVDEAPVVDGWWKTLTLD